MDENTPKRTTLQDDEFDIEVLFSKLNRINRKIWLRLTFPFRILFFNTRTLLITLFICVALSAVLRFTLPKIYSASFIYEPTLKADLFHLDLLADLDALFKENNEEHAADLLHIDVNKAEQVHRIFYEVQYKNEFRKDTIMSVEVEMLADNNSIFDTLQQSILTYLMKSPHYLKLLEMRKLELNTMEEKLLQDIEYNDSLKRTLAANAIPRGNGGFVYGEPIDPVRVNESGINLIQRLISVRSQKQFINNFELVKPVVIKKKPYFPRFSILLPVLSAIGLIVVCVMNYKKMNAR
jgi:hypothetical protein